jgi:hypothetical protein
MGDTTGADMFYKDASKRVNDEFDRQRSSLDENLINRGIGVGTKQYTTSMGDLADKQNQNLNELATESVMKGQELDANRINNANALASGRDIGLLANIAAGGKNNLYSDQITQANAQASAKASANATQANNLIGTLAGMFIPGLGDKKEENV